MGFMTQSPIYAGAQSNSSPGLRTISSTIGRTSLWQRLARGAAYTLLANLLLVFKSSKHLKIHS